METRWTLLRASILPGAAAGLLALALAVANFDEPLGEFSGPRFVGGDAGWLRVANNVPVFIIGGLLLGILVAWTYGVAEGSLASRFRLGPVGGALTVAFLLWGLFQALSVAGALLYPERLHLNTGEIARSAVVWGVLALLFGRMVEQAPVRPRTPAPA